MSERWLVDIGSTRLKWQVRDAHGALKAAGLSEDAEACAGALLAAGGSCPGDGSLWLSRVGPETPEAILCQALKRAGCDIAPRHAASRAHGPHGLRSTYDPVQLGVDRYCALVGARARCDRALVIVDAGTAVSVDLLDATGVHRGGYLLPGRRLGWASLQQLLPDRVPEVVPPERSEDGPWRPGRNTRDALDAGWGLGLAGAVERLLSEGRRELGQAAEVWLTGGDADWLAASLAVPVERMPGLVLDGLWELSREAEDGV
ncbi:MAG: type III pantothenate kinase [Pseudomonadota bacterium]